MHKSNLLIYMKSACAEKHMNTKIQTQQKYKLTVTYIFKKCGINCETLNKY